MARKKKTEEPKTLVEVFADEPAPEVGIAEMIEAEEIASAPVSWSPKVGRIYEFIKPGDAPFLGLVIAADPLAVEKLTVRSGCRVNDPVDVEGCEIFEVTAQEVNERLN